MYKVQISRKAQKSLSKIPSPYINNVKSAILALAQDPRPIGYIKLKNRNAYRIRIANYRVIYEIHDQLLLVKVVDTGHRKDIY